VATRILHVSDLHLGSREAPEPLQALPDLVARLEPEVLVATGDLSHRGRRDQFERAAELLHRAGAPLLAVPGNHDIPYTLPARYTSTFAEWERAFGDTSPVYSSESLVVVGLNSVRPWRQQGGALDDEQLAPVAERLREAAAGAFRAVALHHHLAAPPWPARRKKPIRDRDRMLQTLADAGADLVLSGHVHQTAIAERSEFEVLDGRGGRTLVLASVAGLGRPRPHRRGEACGASLYEADEDALVAVAYGWTGDAFAEIGRRIFMRRT
jgi:3',5'-cyclic AMP phosphodiesterase CpdA